jgi:hypothetical protein
MVTLEIVFGLMIVLFFLSIAGWAIMLFAIQVGCVDAATNVARQAARGDEEAVERAKDRAPRDAVIKINDGGGQVNVTVRVTSRPLDWLPGFDLEADATAMKEPGE